MKTTRLFIIVLLGTLIPQPLSALEIPPNEIPEHISIYASFFLADRIGPNLFNESVELVGGQGPHWEEKSFRLEYEYSPPKFPKEKARFEVVVTWAGDCKMSSKSDFPVCSKDPRLCEVNISSEDARKIAQEKGLTDGHKDWVIELEYNSRFEGLVWTVSNTTTRISRGWRGKTAIIRASDGKFLEMWSWVRQA